jgi:hypothetical protein
MKITRLATGTTLLLAILLITNNGLAQSKFKLRKVVGTGDNAPVPQQLSNINSFSFNSQGQEAFIGDGGLFLNSAGTNTIIAGFGDAAPGGGSFISVSSPSINSSGQIVFRGETNFPSPSGLFLFSGGTITQLVADATFTGTDVVFPDNPSLNDTGAVAFVSFIGNGLFLDVNGTITKIAGPGDPAPGGDFFSSFSSPAINHAGQLVFSAFLNSGSQGIFLAFGGSIQKIVAQGDVFPNGSVFLFALGDPSINDAGDVAFSGLANGFSVDSGLYLFSGNHLSVVVPAFTPIPSLGGALLELEPQSASLNNAGQIVFVSQKIGSPGFGLGVFSFSAGSVAELMSPGESSPDGDTFTGAFNAKINNAGQVGFLSRLVQHNDAMYLFSSGTTTRIAGQGDTVARQPKFEFPFAFGVSNQQQALVFDSTFPGGTGLFSAAPGRPPGRVSLDAHVGESVGNDGVIQGFFENFVMNSQGQVAFNSDLSSGISSIILKSSGGLTQLVRATFTGNGDPAPGGGTFLGVRELSINGLGQVAFSGFDTLHAGIYLSSNGHLGLAIDGNTPLPDGTGPFGTVSLNAINSGGEIAFLAQSFPNPNGMYLDNNGAFSTIARDGAPAPGGGSFSLGFPDPRFGPAISDNGDVAFAADLTIGGRGVFRYSQGALTRIAGPGDPSPDGSIFLSTDAPTINASGQIAFSGETFIGFGAFLYSNGVLQKVIAPGDRLPQRDSITFADLPQVNDAGQVAFGAGLATGEIAVFLAVPGDDQETDDIVVGSGTPDPSVPHSRNQLKARYPRNFSLQRSPNDHMN